MKPKRNSLLAKCIKKLHGKATEAVKPEIWNTKGTQEKPLPCQVQLKISRESKRI